MRELKFGAGAQKPESKKEYARLKSESLASELNPPDVPKAYAVNDVWTAVTGFKNLLSAAFLMNLEPEILALQRELL